MDFSGKEEMVIELVDISAQMTCLQATCANDPYLHCLYIPNGGSGLLSRYVIVMH